MTPVELKTFIKLCYVARLGLYIEGKPGCGESATAWEAADEMGITFLGRRVPSYDVDDLRGLADLNCDVTHWKRPDTTSIPPAECKVGGIWFLDEYGACMPAMQALFYEPFEQRPDGSRWCAGHRLADNWVPMAAGNRTGDKAVAYRLSSAFISRVAIVQFENSAQAWDTWALGETPASGIPFAPAPADSARIHPMVLDYLRTRADHLNTFDPKAIKDNSPYACERSWHRLSRFLQVSEANRITAGPEAIKAFIGNDVGHAFESAYRKSKLPSPKEIVDDPKGADLPLEPDRLYAVLASLVAYITRDNTEAIAKYVGRLPANRKEFRLRFAQDLARCKIGLYKLKEQGKAETEGPEKAFEALMDDAGMMVFGKEFNKLTGKK